MSPTNPSKRQSSAEPQSEEVCKRLKEDIKQQQQQQSTDGDKVADKTTKDSVEAKEVDKAAKLNNNNETNSTNNNSTSDSSPKSEKQPKSENGESKDSNGAKKNDTETKSETDSKTKTENENQKEVLNGKKTDQEATKDKASESESATKKEPEVETKEPLNDPVGTLLICGGANWEMTGRKELPKTAKKPVEVDPAAKNLWGPHKVCLDGSDMPLRVKGVFSGCNACHSVIVTEDGLAMTFGRNDRGQLGLGDTDTRIKPTVVEALRGIDIVAAACGRSHTLFLSSDGIVFGCGDNKMGQCGTNQQSVQNLVTPARIAFKEDRPVIKVACGAEFSMIIDDEGRLYSFGHPEHGQLGHNSEGKYFTSGNKYAFHCEYQPRRIVTFIEKSREGHITPVDDVYIVDVACGTNHTLAVDKRHRCYSWGFAGYHRLGHSETKNELVPRSIKIFEAPPSSGRGAARVYAGASHSMALDVNGLLYFWGQNKSSGEATMYPKTVQDLCGWKINAVACANRSIFVVADEICISWGPSPTYGELGYGEGKSKSSTVPQEVKTLDGVRVQDVACGFGHTLLIARDCRPEDQKALENLRNWP